MLESNSDLNAIPERKSLIHLELSVSLTEELEHWLQELKVDDSPPSFVQQYRSLGMKYWSRGWRSELETYGQGLIDGIVGDAVPFDQGPKFSVKSEKSGSWLFEIEIYLIAASITVAAEIAKTIGKIPDLKSRIEKGWDGLLKRFDDFIEKDLGEKLEHASGKKSQLNALAPLCKKGNVVIINADHSGLMQIIQTATSFAAAKEEFDLTDRINRITDEITDIRSMLGNSIRIANRVYRASISATAIIILVLLILVGLCVTTAKGQMELAAQQEIINEALDANQGILQSNDEILKQLRNR